MAPHMPTNPENQKNYLVNNIEWWADNQDEMEARFQVWLDPYPLTIGGRGRGPARRRPRRAPWPKPQRTGDGARAADARRRRHAA